MSCEKSDNGDKSETKSVGFSEPITRTTVPINTVKNLEVETVSNISDKSIQITENIDPMRHTKSGNAIDIDTLLLGKKSPILMKKRT
jgi:hypothetical protein